MALLATIAAGVALALAHTTILPGVSLLLVVAGLAIFVDITVAVAFALAAGLLLDGMDVHVLGLSTAVVYVLAAAVLDGLRWGVRFCTERPMTFYFIAVALLSLLTPIANGIPFEASRLLAVLFRVLTHLVLAAALLPLFLAVGRWHRTRLRERGIL